MTCRGSRIESATRAVRPSAATGCSGSAARLGPQWRIPAWSRVIRAKPDREDNMRLSALVRGARSSLRRPKLLCAAVLALLPLSVAHAQNPADFYKGKTIDLYIGYSAGGGYDIYARALARHLSRYIPGNPMMVPKNMPGAGSLVLANWLYNVAPKDGTAFGTIGRGPGFDPLLGSTKAHFDASKFNWIGSMNDEVSVCVAWHTTGV